MATPHNYALDTQDLEKIHYETTKFNPVTGVTETKKITVYYKEECPDDVYFSGGEVLSSGESVGTDDGGKDPLGDSIRL